MKNMKLSAFTICAFALASFFFAFGLQSAHPVQIGEKVSRLQCSNGIPMSAKMLQNEMVNTEALLALSANTRYLFKDCLCSDFQGSICQSLELELGDDFSVGLLDN